MSVEDYAIDIQKGGDAIKPWLKGTHFFRYPLLRQGDTVEKRDAILSWLAMRGIRVAPVTIDNDDFVYNQRLVDAKAEGRDIDLRAEYTRSHAEDVGLLRSEGVIRSGPADQARAAPAHELFERPVSRRPASAFSRQTDGRSFPPAVTHDAQDWMVSWRWCARERDRGSTEWRVAGLRARYREANGIHRWRTSTERMSRRSGSPGRFAPATRTSRRGAGRRRSRPRRCYVDGTLYLSTPLGRVIALDPVTGRERWVFDAKVPRDAGYGDFASRGVSTWQRGRERRIFVATIDARLIALNAALVSPFRGFGNAGTVDLRPGLRIATLRLRRLSGDVTSGGDWQHDRRRLGDSGRSDHDVNRAARSGPSTRSLAP